MHRVVFQIQAGFNRCPVANCEQNICMTDKTAPAGKPTVIIQRRPPTLLALWAGGTVLLWLLYAFVFAQTVGSGWAEAVGLGLANVLPLALLAIATREVLKSHVMPASVPFQMIAHVVLSIVFATAWYAIVLVLLAFLKGLRGGSFAVSGFAGPAFTWQVFQGLVLYALVAAICYAVRGGREAAPVSFIERAAPFERYLSKCGDEFQPVEVADIATIGGAQDYSQVATIDGRTHLVRMSLGEFEQRLDAGRFIRVHRSTIINLAKLERLEPAGSGRLTAHMANGDSVEVSRSGAQLLRRFMV